MNHETRRAIALWRMSVLGPLVSMDLEHAQPRQQEVCQHRRRRVDRRSRSSHAAQARPASGCVPAIGDPNAARPCLPPVSTAGSAGTRRALGTDRQGRARRVARRLVRRDKPAEKEEMKELYIEGVANHDDPESCAGTREVQVKHRTGARAGRVLSREIRYSRAPTLLSEAEGNTHRTESARRGAALRGRRPRACTEPLCARTGRSPGRPP